MPPYYQSEDLPKLTDLSLGAPALWESYQAYHAQVFEDGALSAREKALIALAVANVLQCPYCIEVYTRSSQEKGADLPMMTEALHVGAAIAAGSALAHGLQMKAASERMES